MAKIGYARVSSKEQHLDRQLAALKDVDKLFADKLSGANTNRPELQKMAVCGAWICADGCYAIG